MCHNAFRQHGVLTAHSRTQSRGKPYICGLCCKSRGRANHQLREVGCQIQEKKYVDVVRNHTSNVTDMEPFLVKPYGCGICDKIFEIEAEYMEHCYQFCYSPVDGKFAVLLGIQEPNCRPSARYLGNYRLYAAQFFYLIKAVTVILSIMLKSEKDNQ